MVKTAPPGEHHWPRDINLRIIRGNRQHEITQEVRVEERVLVCSMVKRLGNEDEPTEETGKKSQ